MAMKGRMEGVTIGVRGTIGVTVVFGTPCRGHENPSADPRKRGGGGAGGREGKPDEGPSGGWARGGKRRAIPTALRRS